VAQDLENKVDIVEQLRSSLVKILTNYFDDFREQSNSILSSLTMDEDDYKIYFSRFIAFIEDRIKRYSKKARRIDTAANTIAGDYDKECLRAAEELSQDFLDAPCPDIQVAESPPSALYNLISSSPEKYLKEAATGGFTLLFKTDLWNESSKQIARRDLNNKNSSLKAFIKLLLSSENISQVLDTHSRSSDLLKFGLKKLVGGDSDYSFELKAGKGMRCYFTLSENYKILITGINKHESS